MREQRRRRLDLAGRPAMCSPGRPPVARRQHRQRFWEAIARRLSSEDAAVSCGVSPAVRARWFRQRGEFPLDLQHLGLAGQLVTQPGVVGLQPGQFPLVGVGRWRPRRWASPSAASAPRSRCLRHSEISEVYSPSRRSSAPVPALLSRSYSARIRSL